MCGRKLRCACEIQFSKMCDVRACGAFLGVRSAIAISQVSLQSMNNTQFFDILLFSELSGGPKSQKLDLRISNFQSNNDFFFFLNTHGFF